MRVAVTGAQGRLGRALIAALEDAPFTGPMGPIAWSRPELDLDTLTAPSVDALIERDRPEIVIHAAAWTDVDGCAREPDLAMRRNGTATGLIAEACAARGVHVALVSTNEVFDGARTDGRGYVPPDTATAINAYGESKLEAERLAGGGGRRRAARRPIVRTSWLHGPPGNDFPAKIAAAALRARDAGQPLKAVSDEIGTPTYTPDVADAIVELIWEDALFGDAGHGAGSTTSSTAAARPEPTGRARSCARPASRWPSRRSRRPRGSARAPRRCGPSWSPRRCPRASRCATGGWRSPMPCRRCDGTFAAEPDRACRPAPRDRVAVHPRTGAYCSGLHRTRQRQPERASRGLTIPRLAPPSPAARLGRH